MPPLLKASRCDVLITYVNYHAFVVEGHPVLYLLISLTLVGLAISASVCYSHLYYMDLYPFRLVPSLDEWTNLKCDDLEKDRLTLGGPDLPIDPFINQCYSLPLRYHMCLDIQVALNLTHALPDAFESFAIPWSKTPTLICASNTPLKTLTHSNLVDLKDMGRDFRAPSFRPYRYAYARDLIRMGSGGSSCNGLLAAPAKHVFGPVNKAMVTLLAKDMSPCGQASTHEYWTHTRAPRDLASVLFVFHGVFVVYASLVAVMYLRWTGVNYIVAVHAFLIMGLQALYLGCFLYDDWSSLAFHLSLKNPIHALLPTLLFLSVETSQYLSISASVRKRADIIHSCIMERRHAYPYIYKCSIKECDFCHPTSIPIHTS